MSTELTVKHNGELIPSALATIGQIANSVAAAHVFDAYRQRKAANTVSRQDADLALFGAYLAEVGASTGDLAHDPQAWQGVTWGLVAGFVQWQLRLAYAVGSVNVRLSTVKGYAKLALKAGSLDHAEYALIRAVGGFSRKEGKRVDEDRAAAEVPTRNGRKKAEPVSLTHQHAGRLKDQWPDTPQGRRDALLMCLLLDHGLRVGEVAGLSVANFNLRDGTLIFYRPKVDKVQTHELTANTLAAARDYFEHDALAAGPLMRRSRKDGRLHDAGMSVRNLTRRVHDLGERLGIHGLSAHDCRHWWATTAARNGTPIDRLQDAGGWASVAMPLRYVEAARVANQGVKLEA